MKSLRRPANRIMKWKLLSALAGVFFAHVALAQIPLYQNNDVLNYTIPGTPPPQIDATAFDNESTFTINYETINPGTPFYETMDTLFYTNSGTMVANSPGLTTTSLLLLGFGYQNFACGYNFDLQNANHQWADTFYNPGTIRCVSTIDGNNLEFEGTIFGSQYSELYQLSSYGEALVSATNIIDPGIVDVSVDGLIKFNGRNVDVTGGQFIVEPQLNIFGTLYGVSLNSIGSVGVDTNGDWNAGLDLTPFDAFSSFVPIPPYFLELTNSQSYLDVRSPATNYNIYRYVFVENNSPDIPYKVYIDDPNTQTLGFEPGAAHVEWNASYTDPASGGVVNNYLYLTDDYSLGANTNILIINGVPENFTFVTWPNELLFNPTPIGFTNLPDAYQSNNYSCFFGNLTAATASTNVSATNPHGTITNLPGKIYITASNELNMAFTSIVGPNYLSLNCTNQFDGSPGASIAAPYSDIFLGVTNGFMTVSNLLLAALPNWSGTIQGWSSDWFAVDASGVTNEYKVMLVFSQLQPTTVPWIQNLYLHGTNTLVISDHLNVYGSFYSDARTLTLNTNLLGVGATSLDGELTWLNPVVFNANSGSGAQQLPNLLNLTNSGAIRALNTVNFGGAATVYGGFINNGLIADQGTTVWATNFINSGSISNGPGSFVLQSSTALLTNGLIYAGADVKLIATNNSGLGGNSLIISNHVIQAGRMLTLWSTNLTDTGVTNGNVWVVGFNGISGSPNLGANDSGFNIPVKPSVGDLLGTTVTNIAPPNMKIYNFWSGNDYGISSQGYTNNLALGQLILDAQGSASFFYFNGAGTSNALYVDKLVLQDYANVGTGNSENFLWLKIATNMMIYYAQAIDGSGHSVAEAIDNASRAGWNGGRLRWIYSYAGYFSSTNLVYTNSVYPNGVTNTVNAALAQSSVIDSDGDGIINNVDPTPFLVPSEVSFTLTTTTDQLAKVEWTTIPNATNFIYYTTNLLATNWLAFTNFKNFYYGDNVAVTNAGHGNGFHSPQTYVSTQFSPPDNSQMTNVWVFDAITGVPHYYKVVIWPWLNYPY